MTVYSKKQISQKKILKIIKDWYFNIDWVVLSVEDLTDIKKIKYIKPKYKFIMINKEIKHIYLVNQIWPAYYWYFNLLMINIKTDNSIDYNILWLNKAWLNKFKWIMKKNWLIKSWKFDNMKKNKYFINPLFCSYNWTIPIWLVDLFKKDNKKIYWVSKL